MCQIAIDRVETDTLQQATRITVYVSGKCDHGGDAYMRVLWDNGQVGAESALVQVDSEFRHLPLKWTAHNQFDRLHGVRVVCRCKTGSVYAEREV